MLTKEEKEKLERLYQSLAKDEKILRLKDIQMHRGSNCYIHSFKVAKVAVHRVMNHKGYNLENVILGAILHDYYLYDWRVDHSKKKKHGRRHPLIAEENAKRDFNISPEVSEIIKCHMWPLTPHLFPKSKEAKLINYVDDVVATREALTSRRFKKKHLERSLKFIERLFDE